VTSNNLASAVSVIRALLTADFSTYQRLHAELDASQRRALSILLSVAFNKAAVQHFGDNHTTAEIIEFVAEARAAYPTVGQAVPPEDAESVIRAALGEDHLIDAMDGYAFGAAQTAILVALVRSDSTSDQDVDRFLAAAADQADGYLRQRGLQ
jgi:hypothetical protein